jgi:hypothetical protein
MACASVSALQVLHESATTWAPPSDRRDIRTRKSTWYSAALFTDVTGVGALGPRFAPSASRPGAAARLTCGSPPGASSFLFPFTSGNMNKSKNQGCS